MGVSQYCAYSGPAAARLRLAPPRAIHLRSRRLPEQASLPPVMSAAREALSET
jgi:hypothetical protein